MLGARPRCFHSVLALWLVGACSATVEPIAFAPDGGRPEGRDGGGPEGRDGTDVAADAADAASPDTASSGDTAGKCTGYLGIDADQGGTLAQGLVAYYPCEQASGTVLSDQSGNKRDATLVSSGAAAGYRFADGKAGKALYLTSASSAHVVLPSGLLASACEATIATWVYLNGQSTWQRVWTFSNGGNVYMFLTTNNDTTGAFRAGITLKGNGVDQQSVDGPALLPTGVWTHVAVVLGPAGLALFVDGAVLASSPAVTLRPADMGKTLFDYIGRSNYGWDPYLDGAIDEFRVYGRALSPAEIQALASGSF
jgi:hypothetical protein